MISIAFGSREASVSPRVGACPTTDRPRLLPYLALVDFGGVVGGLFKIQSSNRALQSLKRATRLSFHSSAWM